MNDPSLERDLAELAPLLDQLAPQAADPRAVARLTRHLAAALPVGQEPAAEGEGRLFRWLCAGGGVLVALLYLAVADGLPGELPGWAAVLGAGAGLSGLFLLLGVLLRRRTA